MADPREACATSVPGSDFSPERVVPPARLPWRVALGWAALAGALAVLYSVLTFPHLSPANDVWDYAQQARQIARGEGFTSLYTYPTLLGAGETPPYPVRWRMPLYSWRGAMMISSGTPMPGGFLALGVFAQALLVFLVVLLAAHVHSVRAGYLAGAAAAACPLLLDPYHPGLSQLPVAAFGLAIWLLLMRRRGIPTALAAGLIAPAIWYTRAESLLFVPLWAWAAWRGAGDRAPRAARAVAFLLVFAALCAPWPFVQKLWSGAAAPIQGNPMLLYTPQYPGYSSSRTYLEPMPGYLAYVFANPVEFAARWVKDLVGFGVDFGWGLGPIAIGLAMAGLLLRPAPGRYRDLRPVAIFFVAMALQVAAFAALQRSPRFLTPVIPLACVAAGIAAAPALERICGRRMILLLFLLLVGERAATVAFESRTAARRFPPLPAALADTLRAREPGWPREGLLLTDVPDWAVWHLDRPGLLLPTSRSMPAVMADHAVAAILLSPDARARNAADGDSAWVAIWDRMAPIEGFAGPTPLPGGARIYERAP
ncbi:MAG TPA: hypothetical protein VLT84_08990 [Acidobacteriota bacterium]|nr:hypothetical protein [Acidobacteriota bacterium]